MLCDAEGIKNKIQLHNKLYDKKNQSCEKKYLWQFGIWICRQAKKYMTQLDTHIFLGEYKKNAWKHVIKFI